MQLTARADMLFTQIKTLVAADRAAETEWGQPVAQGVMSDQVRKVREFHARARWYVEQLGNIITFLRYTAEIPPDPRARAVAGLLLDSSTRTLANSHPDGSSLEGFLPSVYLAYQMLLYTNHLDVGQEIVETHQLVRKFYPPVGVAAELDAAIPSNAPRGLPNFILSATGVITPTPVAPPPPKSLPFGPPLFGSTITNPVSPAARPVSPLPPVPAGPPSIAKSSPEPAAALPEPTKPARSSELRKSGEPAPDRSFGEKGAVLASLQGEPCDAQAMCVQPDGCVIVAGSVGPAGSASDIAVARFLPDGSLDEDFGDGGWAVIQIGGRRTVAHAVALQANGKIILAGESLDLENNRRDFILVRLKRNGHADAKFGGEGFLLTDFGGDSWANAVAIQDDGKIVAAGGWVASQESDLVRIEFFALARYNKNGSLDDRFGTHGMVKTPLAMADAPATGVAYALAIQPAGKLVAAGVVQSFNPDGQSNFACARYYTDGSPDDTFGTRGQADVALTAAEDTARAVALQDDGKVVLAGIAADPAGKEDHFAVVRLNADGQPDTSFTGKRAGVTRDFMGGANGAAIQADGAILAAGYATVGERDLFAAARYRADGSADPAFGSGGVAYFDLGGSIDRAHAIAIDSEERILLAGTSRSSKTQMRFALARLLPGAR
jgi:uncharacterized delta-60 repeat protein